MKAAKENAAALALFRELGITYVAPRERKKVLDHRETSAISIVQKMVERHGEGHARLVLVTILETTPENANELSAACIEAISQIALAHPEWTARGWLEAFDAIDLPRMRQRARRNRKAVPVAEAMATLIFDRLLDHFGETIDMSEAARGFRVRVGKHAQVRDAILRFVTSPEGARLSNREIADAVGVHPTTVRNWKRRGHEWRPVATRSPPNASSPTREKTR